MGYAYTYVWRTVNIRAKRAVEYADKFGVNLVCLFLAASTFATFAFKVSGNILKKTRCSKLIPYQQSSDHCSHVVAANAD